MKKFGLDHSRHLCIEKTEHGLRLIIVEEGIELACRKTNQAILRHFLLEEKGDLFKGRLQLRIRQEEVLVYLKTELQGNITVEAFRNAIKNL